MEKYPQSEIAPEPKRIVLTGGPGAGKTAVLELARKTFGDRIHLLPETANILFSGGFPRVTDLNGKQATQRAIFFVQRELENTVGADNRITLCDRGTVDSLAYWTSAPEIFWREVGSTLDEQLRRYQAVIHLRTPGDTNGYHQSAIRIENASEALAIDERIAKIWSVHPRYLVIPSAIDFPQKTMQALDLIRQELSRL